LLQFIARRSLLLIPTLIAISFIVFMMIRLAPGDPIDIMLHESSQNLGPEEVQRLKQELGLNDPLLVQYTRFVSEALRGNLGKSLFTGQDVFMTIMERIPPTVLLTCSAMAVSVAIAVPVGVISATRQYSKVDYAALTGALIGVSMPSFWLGFMLILLFALRFGVLPPAGMAPLEDGIGTFLKHLILPSVTLGTGLAAIITRLVRSSMLEVIRQDYVRTARAKGLAERRVIYRHALKNALIPVVTVLGMQFGSLLGGAIIVETIFAWPGMGRQAMSSILRRDFPMIQGNVLLMCFLFVMVNLAIDILYTVVDPRIRVDRIR
jgi:peptide/nickel transport system permease protein